MAPQSTHPQFLDLPWDQPLASWQSERLVEIIAGYHRHVVRFVRYESSLYALKELPERLVHREYRLLRSLAAENIPCVEVVGIVTDRGSIDGDELDAILITRHLPFSLPYRALFSGHGVQQLRDRLLDGLAGLLVQLHLTNFFWGDCSLSNTLFRRDAGALAAYLVDVETGELQPTLSDRRRLHDLDIATENVAGELFDVGADVGPIALDPIETAEGLRDCYLNLWEELTHEDVIAPNERFRIEERIRRLNELGFDVQEFELESLPDGHYQLRLEPQVVEPGHHRRRLHLLTGLLVQENQARRLLHDIDRFRARIEEREGHSLPMTIVTRHWLDERFEPAVAAVPRELRGKLEPAELYHQILEHRWYLAEEAGHDITFDAAINSFVEQVLPHVPEEEAVIDPDAS